MDDPNEDAIEKRAKALFEAEGHKDRYWGDVAVKRTGPADDTPRMMSEEDKAPYRERADALLIEELKSQR